MWNQNQQFPVILKHPRLTGSLTPGWHAANVCRIELLNVPTEPVFIYSALSIIHLVPELNPVLQTPCWTRLSLPSGSSQFGYSKTFRDSSHARGRFCFYAPSQGLCDWGTVDTLGYTIKQAALGAYSVQNTAPKSPSAGWRTQRSIRGWVRENNAERFSEANVNNENMMWILITNGNMMWNLFKTLQFQVSSKKALRIQPLLELIETGARTEAETLLFKRKGYFLCVCRSVLALH